jgi:hypothetical protein
MLAHARRKRGADELTCSAGWAGCAAQGENMEFPFEGQKHNKNSLRGLLLEEVKLFEAADQQLCAEARRNQRGQRGMPPPSPR